jgi:hypothetical protein
MFIETLTGCLSTGNHKAQMFVVMSCLMSTRNDALNMQKKNVILLVMYCLIPTRNDVLDMKQKCVWSPPLMSIRYPSR